MGRYRLAVDTGGTFCDFVLYDETTGALWTWKRPSTPRQPARAVLDGLQQLAELGVPVEEVGFWAHGTTVATNALLERRGARTGLLITEGFRGIYETMDQTRGYGGSVYDLAFQKPPLLAPQKWTQEIPERLDARGAVLRPLDEAAAREAIRRLRAAGVESVAVCLLFAFLNPAHERRLAALLAEELPEANCSLSSEVLPQIREYPRLSTTVVDAYVAPVMRRYLAELDGAAQRRGLATPQRFVMQSNGGLAPFARVARHAVQTLLSGPAAGVLAGSQLAALSGYSDVITFDMGGTSCDIALVRQGRPMEAPGGTIAGHEIGLPMLDIHTIGAGGGTIAWVDSGGALRVGPRSAGADPGPACYGRGGEEPTVTDANLVLGYLDPRGRLGGELALRPELAERAIAERVARPLGLSVERAAVGILELVDAHMQEGIRVVSTMRGYDAREFALVAFGGAGPLHATRVAAAAGIPTVLIPARPGVTSALGLLTCDVRRDFLRSRLAPLARLTPAELEQPFTELAAEARERLLAEGFPSADVYLERALDLRYRGQGYELTTPLDTPIRDAAGIAVLRQRFDQLHAQRFGHCAPDVPVDVVSWRVRAFARVPRLALRPATARSPSPAEPAARRAIYVDGQWREAAIYWRDRLRPGQWLAGPAVVEQDDSTTLILPNQVAHVDPYGHLVVRLAGDDA